MFIVGGTWERISLVQSFSFDGRLAFLLLFNGRPLSSACIEAIAELFLLQV
jgi:hypothetical protein